LPPGFAGFAESCGESYFFAGELAGALAVDPPLPDPEAAGRDDSVASVVFAVPQRFCTPPETL
jgi:hypothetical protein